MHEAPHRSGGRKISPVYRKEGPMCQEMRDCEGLSRRQVVAGLGVSGVGIAGLAAVCSARSVFADDAIVDEAPVAELLTPHAVPA